MCLNPCCNGKLSKVREKALPSTTIEVLILVVMENFRKDVNVDRDSEYGYVLILVVMENFRKMEITLLPVSENMS